MLYLVDFLEVFFVFVFFLVVFFPFLPDNMAVLKRIAD